MAFKDTTDREEGIGKLKKFGGTVSNINDETYGHIVDLLDPDPKAHYWIQVDDCETCEDVGVQNTETTKFVAEDVFGNNAKFMLWVESQGVSKSEAEIGFNPLSPKDIHFGFIEVS